MQKLWLVQLDWDEDLPKEILNEWNFIREQFTSACRVKIPRWMGMNSKVKHASLQGFADASEQAFACVVYLRIIYEDNSISCKIIAAKTKVAPLKKISLPRLELNAAVLLSSLMEKIKEALQIPNLEQQAWTDSMIVLHWLANHPNKWKTYVANRVAEIQRIIPSHAWRHIESALNPADCASRGITLKELEHHPLWWNGPHFLSTPEHQWPVQKPITGQIKESIEEKRNIIIAHIQIASPNPIIDRFSKYNKLLRVLSLCFRWINKVRSKKTDSKFMSQPLTPEEIDTTEKRLIKLIQIETFSDEISQLQKGRSLSPKSTIHNLDPFIDPDGLLRVGGRIHYSPLTENEKHQVILPSKNHFTEIFIHHVHEQTLHGGLALTLQTIRQTVWIPSGRNSVKSIVHKCITCFRFKKKLLSQKMGNIPSYRLQQTLPFTYTGVDYAGYFEIKSSQRKNAPYVKAYVALFICLTTRAIHLELVSDLSTVQFLKAFKRFIGRRGIPSKMFSDNAMNFIGAEHEIGNSLDQLLQQTEGELHQYLLKNKIEWSTIPARAPHFGGWESGVKLVKYHLKRVLGNVRLCFEDFNTLLVEIEAVVNSRPLWSIPTNTDDYDPLTPGHFLVFRALNTLPEPSPMHIPTNRLNHYQFLQRLLTDFWKVWSKQYIQTLQTRKKWFDTQPNVQRGQVVLVSEDNEAPTQWALGRVMDVHHGTDGLVRVADIKCRTKTLRRPIHKLSLLPILDNNQPTN